MNAIECRERAERCLEAAQSTPNQSAQETWRHLADLWLLWSKQRDRFVLGEKPAAVSAVSGVPSQLAARISKDDFAESGIAAAMPDGIDAPCAPDQGVALSEAEAFAASEADTFTPRRS
jgi:hypothetical protein